MGSYLHDWQPQRLNGIPGSAFYDDGHANDNGHNHLGFKTPEMAAEAVQYLRSQGIQITEWTGDKDAKVGGHKDPGHYDGRSFDVPAAQWSPDKPDLDKEIAGQRRVEDLIDKFLLGKGVPKEALSGSGGGGGGGGGGTPAPAPVAAVQPLAVQPLAVQPLAVQPLAGAGSGVKVSAGFNGLNALQRGKQRMAGSSAVESLVRQLGEPAEGSPFQWSSGSNAMSDAPMPDRAKAGAGNGGGSALGGGALGALRTTLAGWLA